MTQSLLSTSIPPTADLPLQSDPATASTLPSLHSDSATRLTSHSSRPLPLRTQATASSFPPTLAFRSGLATPLNLSLRPVAVLALLPSTWHLRPQPPSASHEPTLSLSPLTPDLFSASSTSATSTASRRPIYSPKPDLNPFDPFHQTRPASTKSDPFSG